MYLGVILELLGEGGLVEHCFIKKVSLLNSLVSLCSPEPLFLVNNSCYMGQLPKHLAVLLFKKML